MRRWLAVATIGGLVLAGCRPNEAVRRTTPASTLSAVIEEPHSVSGIVTFMDGWAFDPGDFPRSVNNGEECWPAGDFEEDREDRLPQLVVEVDTGEVIGEAELGSGEIWGLGSAGFDLPSQLETVLIASQSLMRRATCSFTFSVDLTGEYPTYSFVVGGRPGVVYSQEDLDTLNWVVELEHG